MKQQKPVRKKSIIRHLNHQEINKYLKHTYLGIHSTHLKRNVNIDIFRPAKNRNETSVLFLNDGQDARQLKLQQILTNRYKDRNKTAITAIGIHAGDRIQEYGVAHIPDYKNRGSKAASYELFLISELIPILTNECGISFKQETTAIAGFSLGGLSALDLVWRNPNLFSMAGVFSGSLWWRRKGLCEGYEDHDRIIHEVIGKGPAKPGLSFWFEAGTNDETADRNNNGIIDAIDDTLDLIEVFKSLGYSDDEVAYYEIEGGEHNFHTWSNAFPLFLAWAFDRPATSTPSRSGNHVKAAD